MTRIFQVVVVVLVVAFCFGQMALAAEVPHHWTAKVVQTPTHKTGVHENAAPAAGLHAEWAWFNESPYSFYASPTNSDGNDLWPCFGGGTVAPNADCLNIGDPAQPNLSVALGGAQYTYGLSDCNATSTSVLPCGQTNTWYEDDSSDTTDDLTYLITAVQGTSYIADSGTVDFGPNPYGAFGNPGVSIIIYGDQNFGTEGQSGANNGNCEADFNYPLTSNSNPGSVYVIQAGKTCVAPVGGLVKLTAVTELGKPAYTKSTKVSVCGAVPTPCYTVKYTKKYSVSQTWDIWLD